VTYLQQDIVAPQDTLSISVKQPLRVSAGSVALLTPTVDPITGLASFHAESSNLAPDGRELDYKAAYSIPAGKGKTLVVKAIYQKDALNISGNHNTLAGITWHGSF